MMKKLVYCLLSLSLLIISACGNRPSAAQASDTTATAPSQDPCSSENLPVTVQETNDLMREFDDASALASNTPLQQLPNVISNMQRIRRAAEDVKGPPCLGPLRTHQLNHMNLTIQTFIAFMGGANQETLKNGLGMARQEHDLYSLEIVRLLGITLAPVTTTPLALPETPAASSTP